MGAYVAFLNHPELWSTQPQSAATDKVGSEEEILHRKERWIPHTSPKQTALNSVVGSEEEILLRNERRASRTKPKQTLSPNPVVEQALTPAPLLPPDIVGKDNLQDHLTVLQQALEHMQAFQKF